jgi:hypothetical protein
VLIEVLVAHRAGVDLGGAVDQDVDAPQPADHRLRQHDQAPGAQALHGAGQNELKKVARGAASDRADQEQGNRYRKGSLAPIKVA